MITVQASQWLTHHQELHAQGLVYFDFLAATDLGNGMIEVVSHVLKPNPLERVLSRTVTAEGLDSLTNLYPAANWHEREAMELLGIDFVGHPDPRPLVIAQPTHPLKRQSPLEPRLNQTWPGLYEPGAEAGTTRRKRPKPVPGVNPDWLDQ